MNTPLDPTVAELVQLLGENQREMFEERAGIRQHLAGFEKSHAEALALLDVVNRYPDAISGVTVFAIELEGAMHWVVTTDRDCALSALVRRSNKEIRQGRLAEVVGKAFGGKARLAAICPRDHV